MKPNNLYVACIDLTAKRCLVVGAGPVGLEKIEGLLAADAHVTVVAPEAIDEVRELAEAGVVTWEQREYREADLEGSFLVIAATSDTPVNTRVHADAERREMLVNVADVPRLCNFMLPAIVREGPLAVAVSTAGASPALAKRMRREAAAAFGPAYAELAVILEDLRPWAKSTLPTYNDRKLFFEGLVEGDPDPIELLRTGRRDLLQRRIDEVVRRHSASAAESDRVP